MALSCEARALYDRTLPSTTRGSAVGACANDAFVTAARPTRSGTSKVTGPVEEFAVCDEHRAAYDQRVSEARATGTPLTAPRWRRAPAV